MNRTPRLYSFAVIALASLVVAPASQAACRDGGDSELSRFWELERASGCGVFGIRSYRPISLAVVFSDSVNRQPTSGNPLNTAATQQPYRSTETRIQLSVRSKVAEGLLTGPGPLQDSLWFGYTQRSSWQLFTGELSRPFRNTDHEPELIYAYPLSLPPVAGWSLRYAGLGVVHQSNGQSLPLSRSWNRTYLMAGAEHPSGWTVQARWWRRLSEAPADDDNPGISDTVGRAEVTAGWRRPDKSSVSLTVRHNLRESAKGSARLDWLVPLGRDANQVGSLRLHTQLFTGYGDSLLDFNRRRTVLSVGLSLVDW